MNNIFLDYSLVHLSLILGLFFITYVRLLGKDYFWVIDDLEGIAKFSESWNEKEQKKIDSYDLNGKQRKFLQFIPELGFPGNVLRFLRLQIGKQHRVIGKNSKGHDVWGYVQSPRRHHILSMIVQSINLVLGYTFLSHTIDPTVAFGACLLFAVHPLTTQGVGWISGINYTLSMMVSLILINLCLFVPISEYKLLGVVILSFIASFILYISCFSWIILLFIGFKWEALVSAIVGLTIFYIKGKETKDVRFKAFKEQNMQITTLFNYRKPIVMFKTLWYYMRSVFIPIKMGLYHIWGYFYEEPIERVNKMFWMGVITLTAFVVGFIYGNFSIKLGIVWFFTYFILFSNFITAQQFVADRYVMISSFGICIILSTLLYGTLLFWVLLGFYAMRTFLHLPTFKNEIDFYASNFLNFRKSEVSLGNLGVALVNQGMHGAAIDTWMTATKLNPLYDVPWYNLYSVFKGSGRLQEARDFLKKCLDSKVVHFEKRWKEEFEQIETALENQKNPVLPVETLYHEAADHFVKKDTVKELECLKKFIESDLTGIIPEMVVQVKQRITEIESDNLQLHNSMSKPTGQETVGINTVNSDTGLSTRSN